MTIMEQVGVVTGATSGIGRATSLALAQLGMGLALVGRDVIRLEEIAKACRSFSPNVHAYSADLGCDGDLARVAAAVLADFGAVDVLIHSAGVFSMGLIEHAAVAELDNLYRVNVRAPYALTKALLPMVRANRGQIVFINSSAGLTARGGIAAYAATKHALKAIADSLRSEVNTAGIRVITIYPGRTATPQQEKIHEQEGKTYQSERLLQAEDVAKAVLNALAMPRTAEVTDISIRPMQKS